MVGRPRLIGIGFVGSPILLRFEAGDSEPAMEESPVSCVPKAMSFGEVLEPVFNPTAPAELGLLDT